MYRSISTSDIGALNKSCAHLKYGRLPKAFGLLAINLIVMSAAFSQQQYKIGPGYGEVTDLNTGLIWNRCLEGAVWNGLNCRGSPLVLSHESALLRAKSRTGWRLPNIKELASIATYSSPYMDTMAFPDGVPQIVTQYPGCWSSTPFTGNGSKNAASAYYAEFSRFYPGTMYAAGRRSEFYVRLVRDAV